MAVLRAPTGAGRASSGAEHRRGAWLFLAHSLSLIRQQIAYLALDAVQLTDVAQGLFGQLALVGDM